MIFAIIMAVKTVYAMFVANIAIHHAAEFLSQQKFLLNIPKIAPNFKFNLN